MCRAYEPLGGFSADVVLWQGIAAIKAAYRGVYINLKTSHITVLLTFRNRHKYYYTLRQSAVSYSPN